MPQLGTVCPAGSRVTRDAVAKIAKTRRVTLEDVSVCPCDFPAEGVPMPSTAVGAHVDPFNRTGWKELIRSSTSRNERCMGSDIFMMHPPGCEQDSCRVNFLDYVGTQMLAQDINTLRQSIHAPKLNCNGGSYGTTVCGAFVASYAENAGLIELNGVEIGPTTNAYYEMNMAAVDQGMRKLAEICERAKCTGPDPKERPVDAFEKLIKDMYHNPSKFSKVGNYGLPPFALTPAMLYGDMIGPIYDTSGTKWLQKLSEVLDLMSDDEVVRDNQILRILYGQCGGWDYAGLCLGSLFNGGYETDAVRANDYASRFTVDRAFQIYDNLATEYQTSGIAVAFANSKSLALLTMPIEPANVVVGARACVKVLVASTAYDMATPVTQAMKVREALPDASFMLWQGVGHTIQGASYDPDGVAQCNIRKEKFWLTGELPVDGFTCRNSKKLTWPPKSANAPQLKMETPPSSSASKSAARSG